LLEFSVLNNFWVMYLTLEVKICFHSTVFCLKYIFLHSNMTLGGSLCNYLTSITTLIESKLISARFSPTIFLSNTMLYMNWIFFSSMSFRIITGFIFFSIYSVRPLTLAKLYVLNFSKMHSRLKLISICLKVTSTSFACS
jgi:hypothetical protein